MHGMQNFDFNRQFAGDFVYALAKNKTNKGRQEFQEITLISSAWG